MKKALYTFQITWLMILFCMLATVQRAVAQTLPDGAYTLSPLCDSDLRLDAEGGRSTNLTKLLAFPAHPQGSVNQTWIIRNVGNGLYAIQPSYAPNMVIDVNRYGKANGTPVTLYTNHNGLNQRWAIVPNPNGSYTLIPQNAPNSCLTVAGSPTASFSLVTLWEQTGNSAQQWIISPVASYSEPVLTVPTGSNTNQSSDSESPSVSSDSVFTWTDVPQDQMVPLQGATFDVGGYQFYDTVGETIIVPFGNNNLYVLRFAVSDDENM